MKERRFEGWLFIAPWLLGFLTFKAGPMLYSLYLSFTRYDPRGLVAPEWVGLSNYTFALANADGRFYAAVVSTALYAVVAVPLCLLSSLAISMLMTAPVRGISFFRAAFYLPAMLPALAVGLLFNWLLNRDFGLVNALFTRLGFPLVDWVSNSGMTSISYLLATLWMSGEAMMVLIAALQAVPRSYYEAARLDGAGPLALFWYVTLPHISFVLYFNLITGLIGALQIFDLAYAMGGRSSGQLFYVLYIYQVAFMSHRLGYASALAWLLFAVTAVLALLLARGAKRWVYHEGQAS